MCVIIRNEMTSTSNRGRFTDEELLMLRKITNSYESYEVEAYSVGDDEIGENIYSDGETEECAVMEIEKLPNPSITVSDDALLDQNDSVICNEPLRQTNKRKLSNGSTSELPKKVQDLTDDGSSDEEGTDKELHNYVDELANIIPRSEWSDENNWLQLGKELYDYYNGNQFSTMKMWKKVTKGFYPYNKSKWINAMMTFKLNQGQKNIPLLEEKARAIDRERFSQISKRHRELRFTSIEHDIDKDDDYCFSNFQHDFENMIFSDEKSMLDIMLPRLRRVLARVENLGSAFYIVKLDQAEQLYAQVDPKVKMVKFEFSYTDVISKRGEKIPSRVTLDIYKFLDLYYTQVPRYDKIVMTPDVKNLKRGEFNKWIPVNAKLLERYDREIVKPFTNFLLEIWCRGNKELLNYLENWIYEVFSAENRRAGVAIFGYGKQGTGKTTLYEILVYIMGFHLGVSFEGLRPATQKHNEILVGKRLVAIEETSSLSHEMVPQLDVMKNRINGRTILIEPKYVGSYNLENFLNFIVLSNHIDAIKLEEDDRRYICFQLSNKKAQNIEYFSKLRRHCLTKEFADHYYTYIMQKGFGKRVVVVETFDTPLRRKIIAMRDPSVYNFLDDGKYKVDMINEQRKDAGQEPYMQHWESSSNLYHVYTEYCKKFRYTPVRQRTFGVIASKIMASKKSLGVVQYNIMSLV